MYQNLNPALNNTVWSCPQSNGAVTNCQNLIRLMEITQMPPLYLNVFIFT